MNEVTVRDGSARRSSSVSVSARSTSPSTARRHAPASTRAIPMWAMTNTSSVGVTNDVSLDTGVRIRVVVAGSITTREPVIGAVGVESMRLFMGTGGVCQARSARRAAGHRRPPASLTASGNPRRRAMAITPKMGPTASTPKAHRQPMAWTMGGTSQIETIVIAKPTQAWVVSAVPTYAGGEERGDPRPDGAQLPHVAEIPETCEPRAALAKDRGGHAEVEAR